MNNIEIIDFTLRGSVGGVSAPDQSDFLGLAGRSIGGVLLPSGWVADSTIFRYDIGLGGGGFSWLTISLVGMAGLVKTFSRSQTTMMVPVNRVAIFPDVAKGSDLVVQLITMSVSVD